MLHITTRIEGRKHDDLLSDKAERVAFPSVVLMTETGEALTQVHGMSMAGYKQLVSTAQTYVAAKKKVDGGDAGAKVDFAIAGAKLGKLDIDELDEALEGVTLTDAQKKTVAQLRVDGTLAEIQQSAQRRWGDPKFQESAGKQLAEIYKSGAQPSDQYAGIYWSILSGHAKRTKDAGMMEAAIAAVKKIVGDKPNARAKAFLDQLASDLAAMKKDTSKPEETPEDDEEIDEGG